MDVIECKTKQHLNEMVSMSSRHPAPEYDCSFVVFEQILRELVKNEDFRAWIAYEDGIAIGYVSGCRVRLPRNEVSVFDIYLEEGHRGKGKLTALTDKLKEWAIADNALRVTWTTKHQYERWQRVLGYKLAQYQTVEWVVKEA